MEIDSTHGFPPGYFTVKSVASNRLLDVAGDAIEDGTDVLLWVEKEKSLVESKIIIEPNTDYSCV